MDKSTLYTIIDEKSRLLQDLSDKIWEYAELSMMEHKSTAAYLQILKEQGFTVEENLCGIPTENIGRSRKSEEMTDYARSCMKQMKTATDRLEAYLDSLA